ncbi:MAG TPA: peptidoglycan recognition family protein [Acidobacteriaceae bacterium]|jgi:hypothetical protein
MPALPHWPTPPTTGTHNPYFGEVMTTVLSVIIHETTGYPTYQAADNFSKLYVSPSVTHAGIGPQFYISGNGTVYRLMDVDPPRTTWHATYMNGMSIGIENGDLGDQHELGPVALVSAQDVINESDPKPTLAQATASAPLWQATARRRWRSFSTDPNDTSNPPDPSKPQDLTNIKLHMLLHPGFSTDAEGVLIWFGMPNYDGPQNVSQLSTNFRRMLFTEPNFRSLVLLCRYLAEQVGIPRNFPILPYVTMDQQSLQATGSAAGEVAKFRSFVMADERANLLATAAGTTIDKINNNDASLPSWFQSKIVLNHDAHGNAFTHNTAWTGMFSDRTNGYRGFAGHGLVGDTQPEDSHSMCPGPFFDWHRFSREVWDWWWYPFDFSVTSTGGTAVPSQTMRAYRKARGDTRLREYYYDADGQPSDYTNARLPVSESIDGANVFTLPAQSPVYALANGVVVAARIPNSFTAGTSRGFLLVRHEVFCQAVNDSIDYGVDPTYVYSLIQFVESPQWVPDNISDSNPDWYNRFLMRLKETELAVKFNKDKAATDTPLRAAWGRALAGGGGQRRTLGEWITGDATAYRAIADLLANGQTATFPIELRPGATPVRVALGDFVGYPGTVDGTLSGTGTGVLVDIFTASQLTQQFSVLPSTVSLPTGHYMQLPVPSYDWWETVCTLLALEQDSAKELPLNGLVWHYDTVDFLAWVNRVTWGSEWKKYGPIDPVHTGPPARPKSRK